MPLTGRPHVLLDRAVSSSAAELLIDIMRGLGTRDQCRVINMGEEAIMKMQRLSVFRKGDNVMVLPRSFTSFYTVLEPAHGDEEWVLLAEHGSGRELSLDGNEWVMALADFAAWRLLRTGSTGRAWPSWSS